MKYFTKKHFLILWLVSLSHILSSQTTTTPQTNSLDWVQMMQDPSANFYDVQNAFYAYWNGRAIEKGKGYKQFKRWEAYMEPRVYPSGDMKLPTQTFQNFLEWEETHPESPTTRAAGAVWAPMGPFGVSTGGGAGRLNFLRFDPTNSNTMYVGAPDGGLWKSTNSGASWSTNTDQLTVIGCSDIAIDPTNTQIMYLATGDGDAGDSYSTGILKSIDGGLTWSPTGLTWTASQGNLISKILINPSTPTTLLAATSLGIYRTTNSGTTWTLVQSTNRFYDIEFKPSDPNTVYASGTVIYKSTNNGVNWTQVTSGVPSTGVERMSLAVSVANSAFVYILAGQSSDQGLLGIYKSTDSGTTFTLTKGPTAPNLLGWNSNGGDAGGQAFYDLAIAVSPTDANLVLVGGVNIWKSTNGGTSWTLNAQWTGSGAPYVHSDHHDIVFLPGSGTTYFSACDGGLFKTVNNGTAWTDISSNLTIAQQYRLSQSATTEGLIIAGHQDNGINKLSATAWSQIKGGDGMDCFIDRTNNSIMYGAYVYGDYARSTNGGSTWSTINTGIPNGQGSADWLSVWHQDPTTTTTLYAGGRAALYKTTNSGTSWSAVGTPSGTGNIIEFAIAPSNNQIIYSVKSNAISKSINGGTAWTNITGSIPTSNYFTNIAVHNTNPNIVWITISGFNSSNKVFKTIDGGTTWTNISTGLPNIPCNAIVFQNGATNDPIYIGTDIGVYYRDNLAGSWVTFYDGLPKVSVRDLEIFYPTNKIRVATFGRGVWENSLLSIGSFAPSAEFTGPTSLCVSSTATFTDASAFAPTSWSWSVTPGTAGVDWSFVASTTSASQNPHIQFNVIGNYTVTLIATNAQGSNTMTKSNYLTIIGGTAQSLPINEGFTATLFPTANWSIINTNASVTWARSATVGFTPTAGNSMVFNNYNTDDSGNSDEMRLPKASFSNLTSAQLVFDVAYAPYDATNFDGLEVFVSTDCGATFTTVYSKSNTALATAPAVTATFIPTAAQWRTETVNLTTYVGQANVIVGFRNIAGYGNLLYVDNINLTGVASVGGPIAGYTASATTVCVGSAITFTNTSTNTPTSNAWTFAGGTPPTSTITNPIVTYNTPGTYAVSLLATNGAGSNTSTQTNYITVVAMPITPSISTSGSTAICQGSSVVLTSSSATGNTWSNGATTQSITVTIAGAYTVTVSNGTCSSTSSTTNVTLNSLPTTPTISAGGPITFCIGGNVVLTSSSPTGNTWSTGATTQSITVTTSGTYTTTYSNGTCASTSTSTVVSVNSNPSTPTVSANGLTTFCQGGSVVLTSSSTSGNTWSNNATTQSIIVTTAGNYSVTVGSVGCSAISSTTAVVVNALSPTPTITASGPITFCQGGSVTLTSSSTSGNVWSNGATTQSIIITNSGVSTVSASSSSCPSTSSPITITTNQLPVITMNTFSTECVNWSPVTLSGQLPIGGTYSGTGVTSNTFAPNIAGIGSHLITYTYTDANSCTNTGTTSILVDACAGIDEVSTPIFEVYPNPNEGEIHVKTNNQLIDLINIINETGQIVKIIHPKNDGDVEIFSIADLSNGIYRLVIYSNNSQKIIKTTLIR